MTGGYRCEAPEPGFRRPRVEEPEMIHSTRQLHGLERMDQVKYAVLATSGGISIVPRGPGG